ncbi:MAG: hypothetical protein KGJ89_02410 [Patescibacteria group bacterium]|nr:hypothetical protein [Patescibacteria group bacterium]
MSIKIFTKLFSCLAIIALLGNIVPANVRAATTAAPFKYTRIFYFRDNALARQSLYSYYKFIDVLAPQSYSFDSTGKLVDDMNPTVLDFAKQHNIKVMPLVTNGKFSQDGYHSILDDKPAEDAAIASLVTEAQKEGYWGWQIDFEQMDASYRDKFSAFVKNAADAMKQNGLVLSVAVVAKVSDNPADYPNNLWQNLIGVYDYASLATSTDFISLMSYDDPNSKGPVVQYSWLKQVLDYALKFIPNDKLSLGIPLYYWQWNDVTGKRIGIGGRDGIYSAFKKHYITVHYSAKHEAPYLTYWSYSKSYTIWYENAQSVKAKVALIKKYKLYGFSAWALGLELPSIYNSI